MAIITKAGQADIATASFEHIQVSWNRFVIGDGNGVSYVPDEDQKALVNQVYEGQVSGYTATDEITGFFEIVLPADVGGFMIREIGILNEDGELVAVDCMAQDEAQPKVKFNGESASRYNDFVIRVGVHIDNADIVKVQVDPYTAVASRGYVDERLTSFRGEFNETTEPEIEEIFEMAGGSGGSSYPEDWEEATESDIDALF